MPADFRTKLKALVEEWHASYAWTGPGTGGRNAKDCADQLAALLAESEPEFGPGTTEAYGGMSSGGAGGGSKAKLPLGHGFVTASGVPGMCQYPFCGQPRSAHEPK